MTDTESTPNQGERKPSRVPNRGRNGKFAPKTETPERDARAAEMRTRGEGYAAIAKALGFADESGAHRAVQRALKAKPAEVADDLRAVELERLDDLYRRALQVAEREHLAHGNGRIVYQACDQAHLQSHSGIAVHECAGRPVLDDGPLLSAIDRLLKIQERRAKLMGLDAPTRHSVDAEQLSRDILNMIRGNGDGDDPA